MTDKSRIILAETANGFGFGVLMTTLNYLFSYILPDCEAIRAMDKVLVIASIPAELIIRYCLPPHIYVGVVAYILLVIIQWAALGFIIGCWKHWKTKGKPQQGGPGYRRQGAPQPDP